MNANPKSMLLPLTKWSIWLMMGLIIFAGAILALVAVQLPFEWTDMSARIARKAPGIDLSTLLPRLYLLSAMGLAALGMVATILFKLLAIVGSVVHEDPFVQANAARLKIIGWLMIAVQTLGTAIGFVGRDIGWLIGEKNVEFGFSLNSLLSILLVFVLAGVFERGAAMRDDLKGTV